MDMRGVEEARPFVVVEGRPGAPGALAATALELAIAHARADGWSVLRGWAAPMRRDRIVCTGWIRTSDDARRALLAALSGARLAVGISTDPETVDRFLDDLRRLGPVQHVAPHATAGLVRGARVGRTREAAPPLRAAPPPRPAAPPDARQQALLALLSEGLTVGQAARELGLTRRTAGRRLVAARRALGVVGDPSRRGKPGR